MSRRLARKSAFKVLYSLDYSGEKDIDRLINEMFQEDNIFWVDENGINSTSLNTINENDKTFFTELIIGTITNINNIDEVIELNLKSWKINRIAKIDLAILRLAIFEILYRNDVPDSVAINEAVELGKEYGTNDSGSFINGLLGKIVKDHKISVSK